MVVTKWGRYALMAFLLLGWVLFGVSVYSAQMRAADQEYLAGYLANMTAAPNEQGASSVLPEFLNPSPEHPSPCDHVKESQIEVYKDRVTLDIKDAEWATFTDTNSMDPVLDTGANALEFVPASEGDICVGDIVSYQSEYASGTIIHRVVALGVDEEGWYAVMKGDNNPYQDPGRVRFSQVRRVVLGIIY